MTPIDPHITASAAQNRPLTTSERKVGKEWDRKRGRGLGKGKGRLLSQKSGIKSRRFFACGILSAEQNQALHE